MSLSLAGLRVWITRPGVAARRSATRFEELGADCIVEAAVRLEPLPLSVPDRHALSAFLPGARLVLTSANAARYFAQSLVGDPHLLAAVRDLPVSAVGEATARAAEDLGFRVEHLASVSLGLELAREIGAEQGAARVILPGSDRRRPETEEQLRADGLELLALTVYRTLPVETFSPELIAALGAGALDAIALYSPSAVEGVMAATREAGLDPHALPAFLALGPTTAAECGAAEHPAAVSLEEPGEAALLEAVSRWWSERDGSR